MLQFSTDEFRPHERFDHWCEVRAKNVFGVTISLEAEKRPSFSGQMTAISLPGATVAELRAELSPIFGDGRAGQAAAD